MKILVAPDKFKGSLTAVEVACAIEKGVCRANDNVEVVKCPLSDGGDGFSYVMHMAGNGKLIEEVVLNPVGERIKASFSIIEDGKTAVIEVATASGLALLQENEKNPLLTNSYGTGQLIRRALDCGCRKIVMGLGGSATNDAGVGMAAALGVRFTDKNGCDIEQYSGVHLTEISAINVDDIDRRLLDVEIFAACDVSNPLYGKNGAAYVFAAQKGANDKQIRQLDKGLESFAFVLDSYCKEKVCEMPGAGAAGGIGAILRAVFKAKLLSGFSMVAEMIELEKKIAACDMVFTGEGKIDLQTMQGKVIYGLCTLAKKHNVPVIALTGAIGEGAEILYDHGVRSMFSIVDGPMSLEQSLEKANELLASTAERVMRLWEKY